MDLPARQAPAPEREAPKPSDSCPDCLAAIRRKSLFVGEKPIEATERTVPAFATVPVPDAAWRARSFHPADRRVCGWLGLRYAEGIAVGIASAKESKLPYLIAADSALRLSGIMDHLVDWGADIPFLFRFSGQAEAVTRGLQTFTQSLAECEKAGPVISIPHPSPFLQKYLQIGGRYSVAVLTGLEAADAAARMNAYYTSRRDSMVEFKVFKGGILALGEEAETAEVLKSFIVEDGFGEVNET